MTNDKASMLVLEGYQLEQHYDKVNDIEAFCLYKGDDNHEVDCRVFHHLKESFPDYDVHPEEGPNAICKIFTFN